MMSRAMAGSFSDYEEYIKKAYEYVHLAVTTYPVMYISYRSYT